MGIIITGSGNTIINNKGASRALIDVGIHTCPHCPSNICIGGSSSILINDKRAHRQLDTINEFCGTGYTITGSGNTLTAKIVYEEE
jgi:hypothetical protein